MMDRFGLGEGSLVAELASNDGYLLQYFQQAGVPVLGIEPAANVAAVAQENGIEIGPGFSSPNFFGTAGRASAYARFGGATNFGIRYWDPWMPGGSSATS